MDLEFKGTPGPWETFRHMASLTVGTKKMEVCKVHFESGYNENDANLIAAAPEMLKQLKNLVHLHTCEQEGIGSGQPTPNEWMEAVDAAHETVLKALGHE